MASVAAVPGPADHEVGVDALRRLFDQLFYPSYRTRLVRGEDEPLYLPADAHTHYHRVVFAHGYIASALHEVAHWCIAGPRRRRQIDYGYWYLPDGRDARQQAAFEQVEVEPQALEWLFARACGRRFHPSCDNISAPLHDDRPFRRALLAQVRRYCERGLPQRAQRFREALCAHYDTPAALRASDFDGLEIGLDHDDSNTTVRGR